MDNSFGGNLRNYAANIKEYQILVESTGRGSTSTKLEKLTQIEH